MNGNGTNKANMDELREGEVMQRGTQLTPAGNQDSALQVMRADFDAAIADARNYPRQVSDCRAEMESLCTTSETVAEACLFAIERDGKVIEGPSIRMAEILAYCWRNFQVGSRIIAEGKETVTVQGAYRDLERGGWWYSEVTRRIVNKQGRRYGVDMIVTTTNAAQAIAKRNAITSGIPRALWWDVYQRARSVAAGDVKSLGTKRANAIKQFAFYGISPAQILAKLGRTDEMEITRDDLVLLFGILTAIKDEEVSPEEAFPAIDKGVQKAAAEPQKPTGSIVDQVRAGAKGEVIPIPEGEAKAAELMKEHGVGGTKAPEAETKVPAGETTVATPEGDKGPAQTGDLLDQAAAPKARAPRKSRAKGNME